MPLIYSNPRRLPGTTFFTQAIWDTTTNRNWLTMLSLEEVLHQKRAGMRYDLWCEVTKKVTGPAAESG